MGMGEWITGYCTDKIEQVVGGCATQDIVSGYNIDTSIADSYSVSVLPEATHTHTHTHTYTHTHMQRGFVL